MSHTSESDVRRPVRAGFPDCPMVVWLKPWQRWRHPPGCPDGDWCNGNGVCYWRCDEPEDMGGVDG